MSTSRHVLCGLWLWRGQACSADSPENAKETRPTPALPAEDTSSALVWLQSSVRQSISLHWPASPPHTPLLCSSFPSLRLKCFHAFLSLCSVFNRRLSDLYDDAVQVKCPVMLENCWLSCNSESTSVWVWHLIFPLVKSARMYAQVCFGKYLFKLFKKCMSKHPYQYFCFKILIS